MATVGGGAAYKGYQKIDDGLSQVLGKMTDIGAQKNAAKKLADERAGVRLDESVKAYEDAFDMDKIKVKVSNMKNAGSISMDYGKAVLAKVVAAKRAGAVALKNGDKEEAAKQQGIYDSHVASVNLVNQVTTQGNTELTNFLQNSDKHLIQDETHKMYGGIAKNNYMLIPTDDGSFKMMVGVDLDGSGELDDRERAVANDAMTKAKEDGEGFKKDGYTQGDIKIVEADAQMFFQGAYRGFNKVPMVGDDGLAGQLASSVGLTTQDKLGNYTVRNKFIDEKGVAALRKGAKGLLQDPQNLANAAVYSQIYREKKAGESNYIKKSIDDYTPEELQTIEDNLVEAALAQYEVEKTYSSALTSREDKEFNKDVAKGKYKPGGKKQVFTVEPLTNKEGKADGFSVNMGESKFSITKEKEVTRVEGEDEEDFKRRVHINKLFGNDEEKLTFETVIMKDGQFTLKSQNRNVPLPQALRGWVANEFGFETVDGLIAAIKKRGKRDEKPEEKKPEVKKPEEKKPEEKRKAVKDNPTGFGANTNSNNN